MKTFWKAEILQMAESDIVDVKSGADHDASIQIWLRTRFVELLAKSVVLGQIECL